MRRLRGELPVRRAHRAAHGGNRCVVRRLAGKGRVGGLGTVSGMRDFGGMSLLADRPHVKRLRNCGVPIRFAAFGQ